MEYREFASIVYHKKNRCMRSRRYAIDTVYPNDYYYRATQLC